MKSNNKIKLIEEGIEWRDTVEIKYDMQELSEHMSIADAQKIMDNRISYFGRGNSEQRKGL